MWGPGVQSRQDALLYVNTLISETLKPHISGEPQQFKLLDLGCGVGGTAVWLARETGIRVTGISLSAEEIQLARDRAAEVHQSDRCEFQVGDFSDLQDFGTYHGAVAIESFVHAASPEHVFDQVRKHLHQGGLFILCDDVMTEQSRGNGDAQRREKWIRRFKEGWRLRSLITITDIRELASQFGFRMAEEKNLSPYIYYQHPLKSLILRLLYYLPWNSPYLDNLRGGNAGQHCLLNGWVQYRYLVFKKI